MARTSGESPKLRYLWGYWSPGISAHHWHAYLPVILGHPWTVKHSLAVDWWRNQVSPESSLPSCCSSGLDKVPVEYHDLREVFCKSRATSLPPHRPYDCVIDLKSGTTTPPRGRLFSLSRPETNAMEDYLNESLAAGIIRPSSSPPGAGFFFVSKKDRSLRPCIDYWGINEITIKSRYPLLLMTAAFELLQGATIFSKLDLRNAYHLVRIREGDQWKTVFNTPTGHWEYLVMQFGLTNAPAVFQSLVNDFLRDMIDKFVFVYLDDILIFSSNLKEHKIHVRKVLHRLLENRLFVKAEKCEFLCSSTAFLGYIISSGNSSMDPEMSGRWGNGQDPTTARAYNGS